MSLAVSPTREATMGRQTRKAGGNESRGKVNLPPERHHPELNLGDSEKEMGWRSEDPQAKTNPKRSKAGR